MIGRSPSFSGPPSGIVAVIETSVLVRAWLSPTVKPNPARRVMLLAGIAYDSFTSPAIIDETAAVLTRPRFGANRGTIYRWLDMFVRASRQVFPDLLPSGNVDVVSGDEGDLPVLNTAYAVFAFASEYPSLVEQATQNGGFFLVSENTTHFRLHINSQGFQFIRVHSFLEILEGRGS